MSTGSRQITEAQQVCPARPGFIYSLFRVIVRTLGAVLFGVKVIKGENSLPSEGGCILAGNHISLVDPVFLTGGQKRQINYMAKAELFKNPIMKTLCGWYGAFPVERAGADLNSVNSAMGILRSGRVLGIFPEGTRSKDGNIGKGKAGTVMLAHKAGVPIYPFAVYCRRGIHPFCKYKIAFGEPVTVEQLGVTEGKTSEYRAATHALMEIISSLRDECIESR